jgi:hypothetical protein
MKFRDSHFINKGIVNLLIAMRYSAYDEKSQLQKPAADYSESYFYGGVEKVCVCACEKQVIPVCQTN